MSKESRYNPDTDGTHFGGKPQEKGLNPRGEVNEEDTMSYAIRQFSTAVREETPGGKLIPIHERKYDTRAELGSLAMSEEERALLPPAEIRMDCTRRDDGTGRSPAAQRTQFRIDSLGS